MSNIGRNDPCPCGSGKKFKKCCGASGVAVGFDQGARQRAFERLEAFVAEELGAEDDLAADELWGRWGESEIELPEQLDALSEEVFDMWMFFDRPLADGRLVVDVVLAASGDLDAGARGYLLAMRDSAMHLWEVVDLVPGASLTLRDVLEGNSVTVRERSASRMLARHEWIAARVVPQDASGAPEIERGMLHIPRLFRDSVRAQLTEHRAEFLRDGTAAGLREFYKGLPPFFHDVWAGSMLEPAVPELYNTDGERLLITRVTYDVLDSAAIELALDAHTELQRTEEGDASWTWTGENRSGGSVTLGKLEARDGRLVLEVSSAGRAERGRALIESLAGQAVRHCATTHEDMTRRVREAVRTRILGAEKAPTDHDEDSSAIPAEVGEALVLNHMARHYHEWVDYPVPALGDKTPRQAAGIPALRDNLVELIHGLESNYERALKAGEPAYDASWMWAELGVAEGNAPHAPPPLAHERLAQLVPGLAEVCRSVAEAERKKPGWSDASTVLSAAECRANMELRRFLRGREQQGGEEGASALDGSSLTTYLPSMVNFELHRRKTFWVDESLAFMLAHTELDVRGRELRLPFPAFALVFTDRHVLSLGERLLSRDRSSPVAGHLLRVATVYVVQEEHGGARRLLLSFAFDALGADAPALSHYELSLSDEAKVQEQLDTLSPKVIVEPAVEDTSPVRGLLTVALNAILYATSPGVEIETRAASGARQRATYDRPTDTLASDNVYFLPGAIEISALRRYQALERLPDGRAILRRFMVRGHWRRAPKSWSDQRLRWISPYWKGPDMAAIIERTYRLKP